MSLTRERPLTDVPEPANDLDDEKTTGEASATRTTAPEAQREARRFDPRLLDAFPTLRKAAWMIGVSPAALSRRTDLPVEPRGREKRFPPDLVLTLARYYRKRSEYEVASDLIDHAVAFAPEFVGDVEAEIETFFGTGESGAVDADAFLSEARRSLPLPLYRQIEAAYRTPSGRRLGGAVTATPDEEPTAP